uniref:Uncharacterized protein n=1 Tax=uncultured marine virus TaxID=186617 RepID=A0A0F7L721_9VIRU|nr:hypothetical protein [uncultured marine virus]
MPPLTACRRRCPSPTSYSHWGCRPGPPPCNRRNRIAGNHCQLARGMSTPSRTAGHNWG